MERRRFIVAIAVGAGLPGCVSDNQSDNQDRVATPTEESGADQPAAEVDSPTTVEPRTYEGPTATVDNGGAHRLWREIEVAIHNRVNLERDEAGINRLNWHQDMREVAQSHSRHMISEGYFGHEGPEGRSWKPNNCGGEWGENLYRESGLGQDPRAVAERAVRSWMDSEGHRRNIVTESFNSEGVGVAISSDDEIYVTQNLC